MSRLSWGRRPGVDRALATRRTTVLVLVVVLVALASSADALRTPSIIGPDSLGQIQSLLDQHVRTLERGDLFQYERTLDRRSPAFQRCMRGVFEAGELAVLAFGTNRVLAIEQVSPSMVRGYVEERDGIGVQYFRHVLTTNILTRPPFDIRTSFVTWYLTQPEPNEVGELRTRSAEGITLTYRAIDERFSEAVLREAVLAREDALGRAPEPPSDPAPPIKVSLVPRSDPQSSCFVGGYYSAAVDLVLMYGFQLAPDRASLSAGTGRTLRHEMLHWLQWRYVDRFGQVGWWLREGWPDHVLGVPGLPGLIEKHMCGSEAAPPSDDELERGPGPLASGERVAFLYHVARSLVDHLYRSGLDGAGYWRLVRALSDEATAATAFERELGASFETLRSTWLQRVHAEAC